MLGLEDKLRHKTDNSEKKIKHFNILHLNEAASQKSVELISDYRLSHGLMIPDALIAAMAVTYDLELYTYQFKRFSLYPKH